MRSVVRAADACSCFGSQFPNCSSAKASPRDLCSAFTFRAGPFVKVVSSHTTDGISLSSRESHGPPYDTHPAGCPTSVAAALGSLGHLAFEFTPPVIHRRTALAHSCRGVTCAVSAATTAPGRVPSRRSAILRGRVMRDRGGGGMSGRALPPLAPTDPKESPSCRRSTWFAAPRAASSLICSAQGLTRIATWPSTLRSRAVVS